jgi:Fe2+ transport system protein FeoA
VADKGRGEVADKAGGGGEGAGIGVPPLALTALADGESGRILRLPGSVAARSKLESMGIFIGAVVAKKSGAFRRGPVVVEWAGSQMALAFAIAEGIVVEPLSRRDAR